MEYNKEYFKKLCFKLRCNYSNTQWWCGVSFTEKIYVCSSHMLEINQRHYSGGKKEKRKEDILLGYINRNAASQRIGVFANSEALS